MMSKNNDGMKKCRHYLIKSTKFNSILGKIDLVHLIIIILGIILFIFVVFPVLKVFSYPSIEGYVHILSRSRSLRAIKNSLFITLISTITATFIGFIYAYTIRYTDVPGKRFFKFISLLPLLSPPFVVALAWILLFGRRGLITYELFKTHWSIFGWKGLWLVQSIAFFPYSYLIIDGVLKEIDPSLEYAAKNAGANGFYVFKTITFPLALPGILNAAILVGIYVLADFGNPIVIAGSWPVLPTEIFGRISGHYDLVGATGLAAVLLIPTFGLFLLNRTVLGGKSFVTITGKGTGLEKPLITGIVKWILFGFCLFIILIIISVYGILLIGSFTKTWGIDWSFSLNHWYILFGTKSKSLYNSIMYALFAGGGAAVFSLFATYFIYGKNFAGKKILDFLVILPAAIPGIFLGVGFLLAFNNPPLLLTGTSLIIILGLMVWNIPLGYQACTANFEQITSEIEEGAINLGANSIQVFKDIMFPLLKSPFLAGFIMGFLRSITNLSIVIFLISPGNNTATAEILSLIQYAELGPAIAICIALFGIALLVIGVTQLFLGRGMAVFTKGGL